MLLTFQFPLADCRPFAPELALRLPFPDWPEPASSINPQFMHRFGVATERIREPDAAWPDEISFCRARRGLRFVQLENWSSQYSAANSFSARCAFRRLFCDGQAVVRIEIGIANRTPVRLRTDRLNVVDILNIIRDASQIPTIVPIDGRKKMRPILTQGGHLAQLFAHASMNPEVVDKRLARQLIDTGDPLILAEVGPREADLIVESALQKDITVLNSRSVNGAEALFCRLKTTTGIVSTWILQKGSATLGQLRSLRICLTRLHAEREVLDLTLKQIRRGRLLNPSTPEAVDLLDRYFNERLKIVNRNKWAGISHPAVLAAFDATEQVVRPASKAQLIKRYEGSRRQVWEKIRAFQESRHQTRLVTVINPQKGAIMIDKQVNVSGTGNIVNVAEYMSNVTNTVNNNLAESNADEDIKKLIEALNKEIAAVAPNADPAQTKKLGKNLEALSKEVASDEPDRRWYEVSLAGLKEAAEAIGDIAAPILKTVGKLSTLLLI